MYTHSTNEIVMVEPAKFFFNAETAVNNAYQNVSDEPAKKMQEKAIKEFWAMVEKLRAKGVKINVIKDTTTPSTPDSIFPNNWFSTHEGGLFCLYPMFAKNRREELRKHKNTVISMVMEDFKKEIHPERHCLEAQVHSTG